MSLVRKFKPNRSLTGILVPFSTLPVMAIAAMLFGLRGGITALGVMMALFAVFFLYQLALTGNLWFLVPIGEAAAFSMLLLVFEPHLGLNKMANTDFRFLYTITVIFFTVMVIVVALAQRLKWRGTEVFELAGEDVDEIGDGYTHRPRPVGKVDYSPEQMRAFARFCARNLIALPYVSSKNITLVPIRMGDEYERLLGLSGDYRDATWVNFDMNGEVSVHIAHKDYLEYCEPLAFDPLCAAFGQLFINFLDLHEKGEGVRIMDRMNDLRLGIFA